MSDKVKVFTLDTAEQRAKALIAAIQAQRGQPGFSWYDHEQAIAAALRAEREAALAECRARGDVSVHGTDGCMNCDMGRITMYAASRYCIECQNAALKRSGAVDTALQKGNERYGEMLARLGDKPDEWACDNAEGPCSCGAGHKK